ncbi:hypothetical protein EYF80_025733 [Liparis tanakae]|uniref:Uncharacterized protein n=1 Tax=Liparis tanakae TaxID=230148 RepID=A0A4Z2HEM0_9TELE|nr:hypothetical protein EYF80_025733 [Liparis tanakae]
MYVPPGRDDDDDDDDDVKERQMLELLQLRPHCESNETLTMMSSKKLLKGRPLVGLRAQNFNPSGSGCSRPRNHSRVRGLELIGTGSNACWIEEERDARPIADPPSQKTPAALRHLGSVRLPRGTQCSFNQSVAIPSAGLELGGR